MLRELLVRALVPVMGIWQEVKREERRRWEDAGRARIEAMEWERKQIAVAVRVDLMPFLREVVQAGVAAAEAAEGGRLFEEDVKRYGEAEAKNRRRRALKLRHPDDIADVIASRVVSRLAPPLGTPSSASEQLRGTSAETGA